MRSAEEKSKLKPYSPFQAVFDWWHEVRDRWQRMHDLDGMSSDDVARMASDCGMTSEDLRRIAKEPNGTVELLYRRLEALHLKPEDVRSVSPLLLRDLERTCAMCADKVRCKSDMDQTADPVGWESYCPNSGTLRTLA
ncbi:MAG: hypothetical protein ABL898_02780 [Hyphomicrobiaceae bacterium]|nr:hypothetical protein [Hyphomicrobiaceae bacterium]